MQKVAIYARVSTEEQKLHGLSIAAQKQALHEYCKENELAIYDEYVDEGVSAGALTKRKEMQRLLDDCRAGKVKLILFTKLDRWFRHVDKYHAIQNELTLLNVSWKAIQEPVFETVTAMGKANINFYLTTAQIEVDRASERISAVVKYKTTQGHALTGNMPFGYKIGPDKKPMIDEATQPIAMYVLTEYERIQSKRRLIDLVQEKFNVSITYMIVTEILRNRRYTGYFRGNPDYFPKMISITQYDRNQELLKKNGKIRKSKTGECRTYIFSSLLKCRDCGTIMGSARNNTSLGYRCRNWRFNRTCGNNKVTTENVLEANLLARIKDDVKNIKLQAEIRRQEQSEENEVDVEAIQDEMKRLNMMFRKGRIDEDEYDAECEALENMLHAANIKEPNESMDLVLLPEFDELYQSFDRLEKRNFWRDILEYVEVKGREFDPHFSA